MYVCIYTLYLFLACVILIPRQGIKPHPLQWKHRTVPGLAWGVWEGQRLNNLAEAQSLGLCHTAATWWQHVYTAGQCLQAILVSEIQDNVNEVYK